MGFAAAGLVFACLLLVPGAGARGSLEETRRASRRAGFKVGWQKLISSPAVDRFKYFSGSTSNGVIKVHWDLKDEQGRRSTNEAFDTLFHITLPDSGRSQTLKGP